MKQRNRRHKFKKDFFEKRAWSENRLIIGVDEVGRGCLAGPVVAGAVILKWKRSPTLLKDSKILTPEQRERSFSWIGKHSWAAVGIVNNQLIDQLNIYHATLLAMRRAVLNVLAICPHRPTELIIDAMPLNLADTIHKDITVHHFPFGEEQSSSIAAASIHAKVMRDRLMAKMDAVFPGYRLGKHKGYTTPEHKQLIREHGRSVMPRLRFLRGAGLLDEQPSNNEYENQHTLFDADKRKHETVR